MTIRYVQIVGQKNARINSNDFSLYLSLEICFDFHGKRTHIHPPNTCTTDKNNSLIFKFLIRLESMNESLCSSVSTRQPTEKHNNDDTNFRHLFIGLVAYVSGGFHQSDEASPIDR